MADPPPDTPTATYRLQLNSAFGFEQATAIVPYLARLGISHIYASPFLKARAGSTHGYDIVDYNQLNPELGDWQSFVRFSIVLREHRMGMILDFVPNHMGVGKSDNPWWLDVLEWGRASPYARFFDIDWSPPRPALADKVLLPILGATYGAALCGGEIRLDFDPADGSFSFWYHDHRMPLAPRDYAEVLGPMSIDDRWCLQDKAVRISGASATVCAPSLREASTELKRRLADLAQGDEFRCQMANRLLTWRGQPGLPASFSRLADLLQRQAYRLAHWRVASDEINYRRFFDISDLAGVRMDDSEVFDAAHDFIGQLFTAGMLQGLRIDHVDGLADPEGYCLKLREFVAGRLQRRADGRRRNPYILVEKILAQHERLRRSWRVAGTTGYDHIALVNGLFVLPSGVGALERHWRRFTGNSTSYEEELYRCRRLIIYHVLNSELATLTNLLVQISEDEWFTRDFTRQRLREGLIEIVAAFPVYRTYVTERGIEAEDRRDINWAIEKARRRWIGADSLLLDFIRSLLTLDIARDTPAHYRSCRDTIHRFLARFQQYTGAVAAKAVEDTLFYRYVPLVSLNEVGCDPRRPSTSLKAFHRAAKENARRLPHAMLASETHDTKRAEDLRARLNVLSELPGEWERRVTRWRALNRSKRRTVDGRPIPSPNDEYLLYQTIVGYWPDELVDLDNADTVLGGYRQRLQDYAVKASREAKLETSWITPDERYEQGLADFITRTFAPTNPNPFLAGVSRFVARIANAARANALAQLVLKLTMPGVPDFYQGSETWDFSLVDPDNRRPVDFAARLAMLARLDDTGLVSPRDWQRSDAKLRVMRALLALRSTFPRLFFEGSYERVDVEGPARDKIIAYARRHADAEVTVVVCRLIADKLFGLRGSAWPAGTLFNGSVLRGLSTRPALDVLSNRPWSAAAGDCALDRLLKFLPVAVLLHR
jgi:(1->4)-alpha-D-glucan 1-alpha-D-glucosylmutase